VGPERHALMHGAILDENMGAQVRELQFHVARHHFDSIKYLNSLELFNFYETSYFCLFFPQKKKSQFLFTPNHFNDNLLVIKTWVGKRHFGLAFSNK